MNIMIHVLSCRRRFARPLLLLGVPLLILALTSCSGPKLSVESASMQKYYGGAAGSGGGNIYRVYIGKNAKTELRVDRVWVGNREEGFLPRFAVYRDSSNTVLRDHLMPRDLLLARVEFTERFGANPDAMMEGQEAPPPPEFDKVPYDLPEDFQQGAVIWYTLSNGETASWTVEEFEQLQPIYHP